MELDARAEGNVPPNTLRSDRSTLRFRTVEASAFGQEVVFALNLHVVVRTRPCRFFGRCRGTGMRRVTSGERMGRRGDSQVGMGF